MLQRSLTFVLNVFLPGAGFAYCGRPALALMFQLAFYLGLTGLVLSRLLLCPIGWHLLAGLVAVLVTIGAACSLGYLTTLGSLKKRLLTLFTFVLLSAAGLTLTFFYKVTLLGIQVYFVPSPSMTPTLEPGDFILVDTWAYHTKPPLTGDIVVFQYGEDFAVVKRSADWPGSENAVKDGQLYVLGDNPALSTDSRKLGGIDLNKVNGRVCLKLVSWSASDESWHWRLKTVN
ncbi:MULTISPECIES: signal peptidase I [Pseudomonas]|uniref:signal peptidase I n=1 Tax=Pseudomonadaceae TaxID=135621 RepID=UPI0009F24F06|nr:MULTISPECIES: signal peptidase I [Pseudomonas]